MKRDKKGTAEDIGVSDRKTDNGENARMHETNTYANAMHTMKWYEMHDVNKMQNKDKNPTTDLITWAENGKSRSTNMVSYNKLKPRETH